ncbi:ATP-dependent nuclease [Anabaena lutea]|uniref:AAA family ATPase n=1 Tax=Anabaena lutea FACHB-196 TaxID=2692881 RepID=A0ABR8FAL9_9NOST|nr:AAA family ATPase [Anabaena lutea]MBD2566804.1 AAA family ATPase [Anabaena lutea FACHB-196]
MRFSYIEIKNFKGINHIRLDLNSKPRSNIYTLVGLNESGKTTILEAINFVSYKLENLDPLNLPGYSIKDVHNLIPIGKLANFNGNISIEAGYILDQDDQKKIRDFCSENFDFKLTREIADFYIKRSYDFYDSTQITPKNAWNMELFGKKKYAKMEKKLEGQEWQKAVEYVKTLMPSVLYFPSFLFDFPDKIYLEEKDSNTKKHEFYRTILQDILDALGGQFKLEEHILKRAKSNDLYSQRSLESVLIQMGSDISSKVFSKWNTIFKRTSGNKEIVIKCDKDEAGLWFLQLRIRDSNELYTISERSLGFRWFFAFLLLTQYRVFRKDSPNNVLFLIDEPASNLHSSAQNQLLEIFSNFPEEFSIIYTTHSHHLINPKWLESTFVVKNEGLDYEAEDKYKAIDTDIKVYKYRDFVSKHPDQTTYFQPILDVLDYSPSRLENIPNVVMIEGKNDFYTLKYLYEKILSCTTQINFLPGGGAGSLEDIIRLYLAWGREFIILLDADEEGLKQKKRYEEIFGVIVNNRIFSLQDIDKTWENKGTEFLFEKEEITKIQEIIYPSTQKFNKTHFNRAIQELYLTNKQVEISSSTKEKFQKIFNFCVGKLG